ncbi:MAG: HAMP domain-containing sensor histidine kinase, partial [Thermosynechococcaceae cyanobacterium]
MSASSLSQSSGYSANSLHPALSGGDQTSISSLTPTVWVCPLPLSVLSHEQLLSELSHELKTPLTGIMGLAQVIQRQRNPVAGREQQYADLIYQKSQQLLIAINDLFDFTQLSIRQFVLQLRPLDLTPIFKTALQTAQRAIGPMSDGEAQFVQDDAATEHWMVADPTRLEQLFTHLTSYLLLLSPGERQLHLAVHTQNNWTAITLTAIPARCANTGQADFTGSNPFSALNTAIVPGESSAV